MEVKNSVVPNEAQLAEFNEPGAEGPIWMVNLLKFRDKAEYEDGRATELSGLEAYAIYGAGVSRLLNKHGGSAVFSADVERLMLGEVEELWDKVAIAVYPSRAAMMGMLMDPEMAELSIHRSAGLAGQLNIETVAAAGEWLTGS